MYKLQVELLRRNKAVKVERSEHAWKFQSTDLMTKTFPMYSITVLSCDTNPTHVQAHAHKLSVNISYSLSGSTVYCITIMSNTKISHVSRSIRILSVLADPLPYEQSQFHTTVSKEKKNIYTDWEQQTVGSVLIRMLLLLRCIPLKYTIGDNCKKKAEISIELLINVTCT